MAAQLEIKYPPAGTFGRIRNYLSGMKNEAGELPSSLGEKVFRSGVVVRLYRRIEKERRKSLLFVAKKSIHRKPVRSSIHRKL
jgi:hypothetical protein